MAGSTTATMTRATADDAPGHRAACVTRLVLVRHGETLWNRGRRIQGHNDIELAPAGHAQAARLACRFADDRVTRIDRIVSSDLARARQTAAPMAAALGLPVHLDAAWRERHFGRFQGMSHDDMTDGGDELVQRWMRGDPADDFDGGESLLTFADRVGGALADLLQAHAGLCVMVVAHGGVLDVVHRLVTGQSMSAPRTAALPNAGVNRLMHDGDHWRIERWGETDHLDDSFDDAAVR